MATSKRSQEFASLLDDIIAEADPMFIGEAVTRPGSVDPMEKGFREILEFHGRHGRAPDPLSDNQYEAGLAARLDIYKASEQWCERLDAIDTAGLLGVEATRAPTSIADLIAINDDLLADPADEIFRLKHVSTSTEREAARMTSPDYVAQRKHCPDFDRFRSVLRGIVEDVHAGLRATRTTNGTKNVRKGDAYILNGHVAYVAEVGERFRQKHGELDSRIRVVFDNATEAHYLARSFAKAVWEDPHGRVIETVEADADGLFAGAPEQPQGHIYAASTRSTDPALADYAPLMLKIGSTTNEPTKRLQGCEKDPTFLLAPASIEAEWVVYAMPARISEKILHAFFEGANIGISMPDRFGRKVDAREWFLVSLDVLREAIGLLREKRLHRFRYDVERCRIVER